MKDKNSLVDFDQYDPNLKRVPFPPTQQDYEEAAKKPPPPDASLQPGEVARPYNETYVPHAPAPDPSQTTPGAPDIRDPDTPAPSAEEMERLNKSVDLKE